VSFDLTACGKPRTLAAILTMLRIYISYILTLVSAFMVWWIFGLFATVAAGYTWLPFIAFLGSTLHFGISSWLFLTFPKPGKILAIATTLLICAWPIGTFFSNADKDPFTASYFVVVFILCGTLIYNHVTTFKDPRKPKAITRLIMSIVPFTLFTLYVFTTYRYFV
jgi:hypothetical protein